MHADTSTRTRSGRLTQWLVSGPPFVFLGIFFLVPALPALVWFLKDNWRKAPERRAPEPTHVVEAPRTAARDPFGPLAADLIRLGAVVFVAGLLIGVAVMLVRRHSKP
mgnify:CR=1 FL=1